MFTVRGGQRSASMSSTEWIEASQVTRSWCGSRTASRLGREGRVLEPRAPEPVDDAAVERRIRRGVDDRAVVLALEVDRVDGAGRGELGDQLLRPVGVASSLKRSPG